MPAKSVRAISSRTSRKQPTKRPPSVKFKNPLSKDLTTLQAALDALKPGFGLYTIAEPDHATAPVVVILPITISYCTHCKQLRPYPEMLTIHQCQHCK